MPPKKKKPASKCRGNKKSASEKRDRDELAAGEELAATEDLLLAARELMSETGELAAALEDDEAPDVQASASEELEDEGYLASDESDPAEMPEEIQSISEATQALTALSAGAYDKDTDTLCKNLAMLCEFFEDVEEKAKRAKAMNRVDASTTLIGILKRHIDDEEVQVNCLNTLSRMTNWADFNPDLEAVRIIMCSVKKYPNSPFLQVISMHVLGGLLLLPDGQGMLEATWFMTFGGVDWLLENMVSRPDCKKTQEACCSLIYPLLWGSLIQGRTEYCQAFTDEGGVQLLQDALDNFPDSNLVSGNGGRAMAVIVRYLHSH